MIEGLKNQIKSKLEQYLKNEMNLDIDIVVEEPKNANLGDISVPMFSLVKVLRKPMPEITSFAIDVIKGFDLPITEIKAMGAYVNIFIDKKKLSLNVLKEAYTNNENYGNSEIGKGKNVTLDYSSPNIAKSFSIGHLRSTMIGNSLKLILK